MEKWGFIDMNEEKNKEVKGGVTGQSQPSEPDSKNHIKDEPRSLLVDVKQQEKLPHSEPQPPAVAEGLPQAQQTSSFEPQPIDMETHAHHLHKAPGQGWRHYLFEFFMLFLAVTLGFFVEDQREHLVEHRREKQYMRSMAEDLKSDTAALSRIIKLRTNRIKIHDSLSFLLNEPVNAVYLSDLYYFSALCRRTAMMRFINNDRTIQQLKNSGGLRLIRKQNVSDSIALYDSYVKRLEQIEERERETIRDMISYTYKIFDGRIYYKMMDETDIVHRPPGNPALLQYTNEDLNAFISALFSIKSVNIAYRSFSTDAYRKAVNLLKTIEEEYHLK